MSGDFDYSGSSEALPDDRSLSMLSTLVQDLLDAEVAVAQAEEILKAKQAVRDALAEREIPDLMERLGIQHFATTGGVEVEVRKRLRCSPPVANREACWNWLEEHGHGGLIKRTVLASFSREQQEAASELSEELSHRGFLTRQERKVESATLTAFANERFKEEQGGSIPPHQLFPMELFGAYEHRTTQLKLPKK